MTSSLRHLARLFLVACALAAPEVRLHARHVQAPAAPATPAAATAAAPIRVDVERFIDRVWVVDASRTVAVGSLYVFLADNVLVVSVKGGSPSVGTWAEDVDGLVLTEKGRSSKVNVLELTPGRFRIRINHPKAPAEITLVPAIQPEAPAPQAPTPTATATAAAAPVPAPVASPGGAAYQCGGDTFRVAFENNKAYVTWPDNTVLVLNEQNVADAPASRRTYSDGQFRVVEDTSETFTRVLFARPGFRPRPCTARR